jgi:L-threonylcarbamoyladenylate synthase
METKIVQIKKVQNGSEIDEVARMLRDGALVAFPTETVYGLGANALNEESVKKIFAIKGRSFFNPLSLHLPDIEAMEGYVRNIPPEAQKLIEKFIPGPLMMLFEKTDKVSDIITAGSRKVGVRVPRNELCAALFRKAEVPVVATSANISGRFSPLTSDHVVSELGGRIEAIISGTEEEVLGIESTIIDVTTKPFRIIRSGFVTQEQITQVLGYAPVLSDDDNFPRSRKLSSNIKIILVEGETEKVIRRMKTLINNLPPESHMGLLLTEESASSIGTLPCTKVMGPRDDMEIVAKRLYACLRAFEEEDTTIVLVEGLPREGVGWALMERLERAASEIIKVE